MQWAAAGQVGLGTSTWGGGAGLGPTLSRTGSGLTLKEMITLSLPPNDFLSLNKKPSPTPLFQPVTPNHPPQCITTLLGLTHLQTATQSPSTHGAPMARCRGESEGTQAHSARRPQNTGEETQPVHRKQSENSQGATVRAGDSSKLSGAYSGQRRRQGANGDEQLVL